MVTVAALGTLSLLAACGGGPASRTESQTPGELAFRQYCQTCHVLPRPSLKTDQEWPPLVERYGTRAKLDEPTRAKILGYLLAAN